MPANSPRLNPKQLSFLSCLHLLIVEDVPEDIELITLALETGAINFSYDIAKNGSEYEACLHKQRYDAVLSDYRLSNTNGWQLLDLLRQSGQDIPFILVTGSLGEEAAVECIKAGMTDYVLKDRLFRLPMVIERGLREFALRRQQKAAIAQIQQKTEREAIVNRIIQAMRETLVLDEVLQTTVDQLHEVFQVSRCLICQPKNTYQAEVTHVSEQTPQYQNLVGTFCPFYTQAQDLLTPGDSLVASIININLPPQMQQKAREQGVRSFIVTPLVYQKSYFGGICLQQCDYQREWSHEEVTLVQAIADQCAIAIHQARLYQQAQTELAKRERVQAQLHHDALHDTLTGLPNRALLMDRLEHLLLLTKRRYQRNLKSRDYQFAVLFLDLDGFKVINDSLGHLVGDQLLKKVALRLQECLRNSDTIARLGGDEFVILLEDISGVVDAIEIANRVHQKLKEPIILAGSEVFISASIGIALSSAHYDQASQFLRNADIAMYRAKNRGRGCHEVFDNSMHIQAVRQLQLENDLRRAIERQEFQLYYQSIVSLETNRIQGFEALVRWQHPEQGLVSPNEFIPIAEDTGLIIPIGLWVLRQACQQLKVWQTQFPRLQPITMSVNLSGKQFSQPDLIDDIDQIMRETGVEGKQLKLEITESVLIENSDSATEILQKLRDRQIRICIDDFGTGYSSLSYLHRFPITTLKVDRSFVTPLGTHQENNEIVKAIVNLGLNLGLSVVAEGIETPEQLQHLQQLGCHYGQGYWFSRPVDSRTAAGLLAQKLLHSKLL